ncbi:MAG: HAMP domain-containing protein [Dactylosporangium sp.]|nr:HAMP domain-containing protein [Dactylosporangium sp.]NNJ63770.1 HAMP domain-containing protein [Dactylosporangium sp.]
MTLPGSRAFLSTRLRLTLVWLALLAVSSGLLMLVMNTLIDFQLVRVYAREPVLVDMGTPLPGDQYAEAKQADNEAAGQAVDLIRLQSLAGFGVIFVVASGVCWFAVGRALRPVRQMTTVARRLSHETLSERIAYRGPRDELKVLADAFDAMLDRLARAFDAQRLFVANASHELRTPLTVIRTAADIALARDTRPEAEYRRALTAVDGAARRSERLLDSLLRLARTQQRLRAGLDRVDLAASAHAAAGTGPGLGPQPREDLGPAMVRADPVLVELLIRNLVDNATRYNVPDGWVAVRTGTRGGTAVLQVENTGPVVPEPQVAHLVRPFHRGAQVRTGSGEGTGLGLAIADAIVHAHAGSLSIEPRPSGGLIVTVLLAAVTE